MLFDELNIRYQYKNLQTFLDSNNINGIKFALKCGFKLVRQSYEYIVNKDMLKSFNHNIQGEISSLKKLTEEQLMDAINMQYEDYKTNHQNINSLFASINIYDWKKTIYEEMANENSYVLIKDNDIIAYIFCYKTDETSIEVGYTGNRCKNIEEYKIFLYEIMVQLFKSYNQIGLEIDDCDTRANILRNLFTYKEDLSWDTYIKDNIYKDTIIL